MIRAAIGAAFLTALTAPSALLAQQQPATAATQADVPDFSGFWAPSRQQHPYNADMVAKLPPTTVMMDDASYIEFPMGEYGGLDVKPEALAKAAQWRPAEAMKLTNVCRVSSVIYTMQGPFPFEIYQTPEMIVFKLEYFDQTRIIFMDGRPHPPKDAPHSNLGHSVGRWEGRDLVIETTHLLPSTITNNGLDHSENAIFVERYRLSDDGKTLEGTQWFTDPETVNNNGARYMKWNAQPGNYVYPYNCDPSFAVEYDQIEEGVATEGEAEVTGAAQTMGVTEQ